MSGQTGSTSGDAPNGGADIGTQAKAALHDAREAAMGVYDEVTDKASASVTAETKMVADRVEDVAGALRGSAEQLAKNEQWLARLMGKGAEELGDMASTLRTNDLRALLDQVQDFAQRQPTMFAGAAVAAGFVAARVARQSIRAEDS